LPDGSYALLVIMFLSRYGGNSWRIIKSAQVPILNWSLHIEGRRCYLDWIFSRFHTEPSPKIKIGYSFSVQEEQAPTVS